jgi:hypothetical protein
MLRIVIGIFIILHGLSHLLFFLQGMRIFELKSGLLWPDTSWAFSSWMSVDAIRILASIFSVLVAGGFILSGIGILTSQDWWRAVIIISAIFSLVLFLVFWDGSMQDLDAKGVNAVVINTVILVALLIFNWPDF